jgi:hypothetical protein
MPRTPLPERLRVQLWLARARITRILRFLKGEFWCRLRHNPNIRHLGGYGGTDVFGRRQKEYWNISCLVCHNTWETRRPPKPLTPEQCREMKAAFGSMWVGPDGSDGKGWSPHNTENLAG